MLLRRGWLGDVSVAMDSSFSAFLSGVGISGCRGVNDHCGRVAGGLGGAFESASSRATGDLEINSCKHCANVGNVSSLSLLCVVPGSG